MKAFNVEWLRDVGFVGFQSVQQLRETRCASVPTDPGVYAVLRTAKTIPVWLENSSGGHFKGRNPTVSIDVLEARMIKSTPVLYLGKADQLRRRLDQYVRFGAGTPVGHWGGRYIWQLTDSAGLEIAWLVHSAPRLKESELISQFIDEFGAMPLANLQR